MPFVLPDAIAVLQRTPATITELLSGLPHSWIHINEGPDTWSAYNIVGHLIQGEKTDWIPRAQMILEFGESKTFPPFNRFAQLDRDQALDIGMLLYEFSQLRKTNLDILRKMDLRDADFAKTGVHPEFGVVALRQLLATWVAHDLGHVRQICRVMAKSYREDIGPWAKYLPVVNE